MWRTIERPTRSAEPEDPKTQLALSRAELREATLRGARWVPLDRLAVGATAFAPGPLVVARYVSPAEDGHPAAAASAHVVAMGLSAGTFRSRLVRARTLQARTRARCSP